MLNDKLSAKSRLNFLTRTERGDGEQVHHTTIECQRCDGRMKMRREEKREKAEGKEEESSDKKYDAQRT
jgi:hypothetical protein